MSVARVNFEVSTLRRKSQIVAALWLVGFAIFANRPILADDTVTLRRLAPSPDKKVLLVVPEEEVKAATEACTTYGFKFDVVNNFDTKGQDYSRYHTVVCGSNRMDYFGQEDTKRPEAFEPLLKFVRDGGHFIMFGTFHGRNTEHLKNFGITCGSKGCEKFAPTPATALFFKGAEKLVPADNSMFTMGSMSVSVPHVALLNLGPDCGPPAPGMITLDHRRGRVTMNFVEPHHRNDLWLITVTMNWVSRGGLTPGSLELADTLLPVPDAAAVTAAETLLHQVLEKDYAKINQAAGKLTWAKLMLERDFSMETDPAVQYTAWSEARANAAAVGEISLALQAIERLAASYKIDSLALKVETLTTISKSVRDREVLRNAGRLACQMMADAISADNYPGVAQLATAARALAQKSQDAHLQTLIPYYDKRAKALTKEFQKVATLAPNITRTPEGDSGRTAVGRFYCFVKSDWGRGLPLLLTGADQTLKEIAKRELEVPQTAADQVVLADGWWELAETLPADQRGVVQRHAGGWYSKAMPGLSTVVQNGIRSKLAKIPSGKGQLVVQVAKLHGTCEFTLTPDSCRFQFKRFGPATALQFNDLNWDPKLSVIPNDGATRILADNIDINAAKLTKIRGRGPIQLSHSSEGLVITVDDLPEESDNYEFKLTFGGK